MPEPEGAPAGAAVPIGALPSDGAPALARPPAAVARADRPPAAATARWRIARRVAVAGALAGAVGGTLLALDRIGMRPIAHALVESQPVWVLVGLALMCISMLARAVAWHAILRAAVPDALPRLADAIQGTTIGVLMSATLPARLGEPSRALIVARRLGRPRERLPAVLGTLVSQTILNVRRAGDPRHGDVHDDRPVRRPRAGARVVRAGAVRRAVRGARRPGAAALRPAVAVGARAPLDVAGAR